MTKMKSTKKRSPAAIRTLKFVREVAVVGAAVTSASVVWSAVFYRLIEFLTYRPSIVLAALVTALVCITVDFVLRQLVPYLFNLIFSNKWKEGARVKAFVIIGSVVCIVLTGVTITLSWHGRVDIAEVTMRTPDMVTPDAVKKQLDESTMQKLADIDKDIAFHRSEILSKENEVRNRYPSWVKRVESGNDPYGYHAGQLKKKMDAATEGDKAQLAALLSEKAELRRRDAQIAETAIDEVVDVNRAKMTYFETQKARNMAFIGFFGPGCTLIFLIFSTLIELSNLIHYDFEQHSTSSYALSFSDIIPKRVASPSRQAPDYMPVGDTRGRDRVHDFLDSKVFDLEQKLRDKTPESPSRDTGDRASGDRPRQEARRPATDKPRQVRDRKPGDRRPKPRKNGTSSRSDKAKQLKRLKDRGRRQYERGQTVEWDKTKATLADRGCTFEYFENENGDPRVRIQGGQ